MHSSPFHCLLGLTFWAAAFRCDGLANRFDARAYLCLPTTLRAARRMLPLAGLRLLPIPALPTAYSTIFRYAQGGLYRLRANVDVLTSAVCFMRTFRRAAYAAARLPQPPTYQFWPACCLRLHDRRRRRARVLPRFTTSYLTHNGMLLAWIGSYSVSERDYPVDIQQGTRTMPRATRRAGLRHFLRCALTEPLVWDKRGGVDGRTVGFH